MRVGGESKAMTSSRSSAESVSTVAFAAALAISSGSPVIEPERSMTSAIATLGLVAPLLGVHAHRQDPLDRRVVPAAEAVAALAAGEEEAAAEIAHVLLDRVLLRERDRLGRRVGEDDEVVALELAERAREPARRAHVDVELLRA